MNINDLSLKNMCFDISILNKLNKNDKSTDKSLDKKSVEKKDQSKNSRILKKSNSSLIKSHPVK